jgi:hypothetical protein
VVNSHLRFARNIILVENNQFRSSQLTPSGGTLSVSIKDDTQTRNSKKMTVIDFPTIRTDRLLLRQFVDSDIENVYKGLSAPEIIQYYGVSYKTLEDTKDQMRFFADLEKEGTGIWWAVCSLDNKTFYGAGCKFRSN